MAERVSDEELGRWIAEPEYDYDKSRLLFDLRDARAELAQLREQLAAAEAKIARVENLTAYGNPRRVHLSDMREALADTEAP